MEGTISVKEAAKKWNLTERRVSGMCQKGNIPGAVKSGRNWKIPANAERPTDKRIKTGAYIRQDRREYLRESSPWKQTEDQLKNQKATPPEYLPLPVGVSDYRLASSEYYYIDKTLMLKDIIDERSMVILFTRPRRFGKTLNMDMIRTFFEKNDEDTSKYFKDKMIWSQGELYRSYQGRFPVIFITLKDAKHTSWENTFESLGSVISSEYRRHSELLKGGKLDAEQLKFYRNMCAGKYSAVELERSLLLLSEMLNQHYGERAIIIVDEYDAPIQSGHIQGFYEDVISFMRNLLSGCFKDNKCLAFGFLTGVLRVAKESIFSGLNNLTINSVLDNKYSRYFGFTDDEVRKMEEYYGAYEKHEEICDWYDGYRFGKTDIFNPWSVLSYFSHGCEARAFWLSTGSNDIISEILSEANEEIIKNLTSLVNGETFTTYIDTGVIYPEIKNNPSSIYSFLLVAGYLKAAKSSVSISGDFICEVALPNREISLVYRKEILQKLRKMIPEVSVIGVEEALFSGDGKKLQTVMEKLLRQSASSFDTAGENFYHGFVLGICALFGNSYVTSNRESGNGRYDIQLEPRTNELPGIVIELKAVKRCSVERLRTLAAEALKQIENKKYDTVMKSRGIANIYKFGVAFSGKNVDVATG